MDHPKVSELLKNELPYFAERPRSYRVTDIDLTSDEVELPLPNGNTFPVSEHEPINWKPDFASLVANSRLWFYSLNPVSRLCAVHGDLTDSEFEWAEIIVRSFVETCEQNPGLVDFMESMHSADHSATLRINALISFLQEYRSSLDIDFSFAASILSSIRHWATWLCEKPQFKRSNHGVMSSISLLYASRQFEGEPQCEIFQSTAIERLEILAGELFDEDGLCNENTLGYHYFNMRLFRQVTSILREYRLDRSALSHLDQILTKAENALSIGVWQDDRVPPIGDSAVFPVPVESIQESKAFYDSGLAVVKSEDLYLSLICGARSENHKHQDDTAITLRYRGRDILIDGGMYKYDEANPYRRCLASSRGHSGIFPQLYDSLTRKEVRSRQGGRADSLTGFSQTEAGVKVSCMAATGDGKIDARRSVLVTWPNEIAIVDTISIDVSIDDPVAVQRFLFGTEQYVEDQSGGLYSFSDGQVHGLLRQLSVTDPITYRGVEGQFPKGWCSVRPGSLLPATGIDFRSENRIHRFATLIKVNEFKEEESWSDRSLRFVAGLSSAFGGPKTARM